MGFEVENLRKDASKRTIRAQEDWLRSDYRVNIYMRKNLRARIGD
jgi:hypothetical protein